MRPLRFLQRVGIQLCGLFLVKQCTEGGDELQLEGADGGHALADKQREVSDVVRYLTGVGGAGRQDGCRKVDAQQ
jgi:hypothetical protein